MKAKTKKTVLLSVKIQYVHNEVTMGDAKLKHTLWTVTVGEKTASELNYEEMLGLVVAVTMPTERPCLQWLKTKWQNKIDKEVVKRVLKSTPPTQ